MRQSAQVFAGNSQQCRRFPEEIMWSADVAMIPNGIRRTHKHAHKDIFSAYSVYVSELFITYRHYEILCESLSYK